mgnify:CR=1 FL=1|jgi:hypothetical protein
MVDTNVVFSGVIFDGPEARLSGKDFHTEAIRAKVMVVTANQAISLLSGMGLWESSH